MGKAKPAIEVRGVGKRYTLGETHVSGSASLRAGASRLFGRGEPADTEPEFWALRDVSFDVDQGEVLGLIGPNGAGKSTLLKMLANITSPTEGTIKMRGRVGTLLEVGTGFHPELTGRENIFLSGSILGMRRAEISKLYDEIVEFSGVEQFLDTPVKRYSSGMHVRLGFAVASALPTDILLVDEVLAVGDVAFQKKCLAKMADVVQNGTSIVFVSHNLGSVQQLCSRSILVADGHIVIDGPTARAAETYLATDGYSQDGGITVIGLSADRVGSGAARFERIQMSDSVGAPRDRVPLGDDLFLDFELNVAEPLTEVFFEVGISPAAGERVVTVSSTDSGGSLCSLSEGVVKVRVKVAAGMLPGEYFVDVGLHSGALPVHTVDLLERVMVFSVHDVPAREGGVWPGWHPLGSARLPTSWEIS